MGLRALLPHSRSIAAATFLSTIPLPQDRARPERLDDETQQLGKEGDASFGLTTFALPTRSLVKIPASASTAAITAAEAG